jgi:predicted transcriptional regulator
MTARPLSKDGKSGTAPMIGVRLPRDRRAELDRLAAATGQSISEIARRGVEREIDLANEDDEQ